MGSISIKKHEWLFANMVLQSITKHKITFWGILIFDKNLNLWSLGNLGNLKNRCLKLRSLKTYASPNNQTYLFGKTIDFLMNKFNLLVSPIRPAPPTIFSKFVFCNGGFLINFGNLKIEKTYF